MNYTEVAHLLGYRVAQADKQSQLRFWFSWDASFLRRYT